jgi:methylmalonyl-CoA carboxyltransferase small subunit
MRIEIDAKAYEVEVEITEEDFARASAPPRPRSSVIPTPRASVPTGAPPVVGGEAAGPKACKSPVAGVVVKVLAKVGQKVEANDPLIVLEAMKMESSITAPAAGTVKKILVKPGDGVKIGQVLADLD